MVNVANQRVLAAVACGLAAGMCWMVASQSLDAHGTEARLVRDLAWKKPRIVRAIALNRSELGLSGSKVPAEVRTVAGQSCFVGALVALDIEDAYAFDIDEPVDVTLTYAAELTTPFAVAWDRNGGDGYGVSTEIKSEPGAGLREVTLRLDRARLAGQGILKTDLAVGARGGTIALCDIELARSGTTEAPAAFRHLRLDVTDARSGQAVPARIGLYDARGRTPLPSDRALSIHRYADEVRLLWVNRRSIWPSDHRQASYVNGTYEARVPSGVYDLIVTRGPEYRAHRGEGHGPRGRDEQPHRHAHALCGHAGFRMVLGRIARACDAGSCRRHERMGPARGRRCPRGQSARDGEHHGDTLDVPFGLVDFIEVLQGGRLNSEIWYRFLKWQRDRAVHFTEYLVNAPPAWVSEFGPSAA